MTTHPGWVWEGTGFEPCPGVPLSDRGFRYGMALFESLAVRGGRPEFLEAHLARLGGGCERLGWRCEPGALAAAGELLQQVYTPGPVFARIYLTAGDGAPGAPVAAPRLYVFGEPRAEELPRECVVVEQEAAHVPLPGGLKTANYWANLLALEAARSAGAHEALLFTPRGELVSACMANVFAVREDGALVTPPLESGARAGVVREWLLARHGAVEQLLERADLPRLRECFLTSSWRGVEPVARLGGRLLAQERGAALQAAFAAAERHDF